MNDFLSPGQLMTRLGLFFVALIGALALIVILIPGSIKYLPMGGTDAIEMAQLDVEYAPTTGRSGQEITQSRLSHITDRNQRALVIFFLAESLTLALLTMIPIAWTYLATRQEAKNSTTFVRALFVLPICATTIVLLIQGSLALAFGLAAMVAVVRFRVRLQEPIDGIYIFAAICVGLSGGIGHMGVGIVMAIFFCYANAILWAMARKEAQTI